MVKRVMVVVLLACVGLTAGVAFGTLFSSTQSRPHFTVLRTQTRCDAGWRLHSPSDLVTTIRGHHPPPKLQGVAHGGGCLIMDVPVRISDPSGLPVSGYVLLGLLAGLSAALGFLVPPKRA